MLAMTGNAAEAINALMQDQEAGLRIAATSSPEGEPQLSLAVSEAPAEGDTALSSEGGAKVFLEPSAAEFLDDKVLDVQQDEEGQLSFAVYPQQEEGQQGQPDQ